jgi:hypothetical protein
MMIFSIHENNLSPFIKGERGGFHTIEEHIE